MKTKHDKTGVYSAKDYENAALLAIGLTIGLTGCLIGLAIEFITK